MKQKNTEVYVKKWLDIGLSTKRIDREKGIKIWHEFDNKILNNKEKVPVIFADSPLEAWNTTLYLYNIFYGTSTSDSQVLSQVRSQVESQVRSQVWSQVLSQVLSQVGPQVGSQVWSQVSSQVRSQVELQVGSQVRSQIRSQVSSQVLSQVWSQVSSQVWSQVRSQVSSQVSSQVESQVSSQVSSQDWSQVWSQVSSQVESFVVPYLGGSFETGYLSYYDYINKELKIDFPNQEKWDLFLSLTEFSFIYPFDKFSVICEKPTKINITNGKLHSDGGLSIEYADGFKVWSLNGIRVPQYLAETKETDLDINFWKKETNADVKAEFVRKYGVERMLSECKLIDSYKNYNDDWWTKSQYELYDCYNLYKDVTKHNHCPHIKMLNQTTGIWHVEGVDPKCKTLTEALNWRENNKSNFKTINIK